LKPLQLNPTFNVDAFLKQNWQKKPVLLPKLVKNFSDAISAEELAGLACEEFIESRLISDFKQGEWLLKNGPFEESDFTSLPESNWTLLVQAVDQWVEAVADIKALFDFLPSWRIDDIMISFAAQGGGVGPHYDYYDVFLLQGSGERNWQVGERCASTATQRPNTELNLLQEFEPKMEFTLSAGDALYIPPRFSHWGKAKSDSLCYSIGFRAPSLAEMIEGFSDLIIKEQDPVNRYEDSNAASLLRSGEIKAQLLDTSFQQLSEKLADKSKFIIWFGCHVSQPKYPELIQGLDQPLSSAEFKALLGEGVDLVKNPSSRFAFLESSGHARVLLFVDGAMVAFPVDQLSAITSLCEQSHFSEDSSLRFFTDPGMMELLRQLLNQGSLLASE